MWEPDQQFGRRLPEFRMAPGGGDFGEGGEDEGAFVQARMGEREGRRVEDLARVIEEIEVERAGGPALSALAAEAAFGFQEQREEILRAEGSGIGGDGGIGVIGLIAGRPGGRAVGGGADEDAQTALLQNRDRGVEQGVAGQSLERQVRTEGDERDLFLSGGGGHGAQHAARPPPRRR